MPDAPMTADDARPLYGIALKIASVVVFVGMQSALKAVGEDAPAGQLVFFRSFFALIPVAIYLAWLGDLRTALRTDDVPGHMLRGLVGVGAMSMGFFALTRLPYPEWIALSYAAPLLRWGCSAFSSLRCRALRALKERARSALWPRLSALRYRRPR
jgi:drug/metabolite transporter (DMT)-like permease